MIKLDFPNENATTRKLDKDIEHLEQIRLIVNVTFGSICAALLFVAVVICPIMIKL